MKMPKILIEKAWLGLGCEKDVRLYDFLLNFMYRPTHPASLAVARILFGLLMFLDVPDERAGSQIDVRWGDPQDCHFPLFPTMEKPPLPWMCILYGVMWVGALGISLGYKFRTSCLAFGLPYWYILLLDKSYWNNHSYLYGLCSMLFFVSSANSYWSIDAWLAKDKAEDVQVPYWNYFLLKFQFFLLYFYAGLKKTDTEWLEGYSMLNMGNHWVFSPFTLLLRTEEIDYLVIHLTGFLLDLTVGFFLIWKYTRPLAMVFCAMFHLMNTRLFSIGMFPYVCLATMPLFCEADWPIKLFLKFRKGHTPVEDEQPATKVKHGKKRHTTMALIFVYCFLQLFLPYSHFITKGYNNWTNGLYGYSWDMMVHSWDTTLVVVRVVDNESGREHFLDPTAWTNSDRWNKHANMCLQYAQCVKRNLLRNRDSYNSLDPSTQYITSENISIYVDVWCSLNGRFQQRMFDPNYDLLTAKWSPFEPVEWLLPLLTEFNDLRAKIVDIQKHVYSWSNYTDVLFVADFPGLSLENFVTSDLDNITLTVIEGEIYYESEDLTLGYRLDKGATLPILPDVIHKIRTVGKAPACFMYTYKNTTKEALGEQAPIKGRGRTYSSFPIFEDKDEHVKVIGRMLGLIKEGLMDVLLGIPMERQRRHITTA